MLEETEYKRRMKESGLSDVEVEKQWQMRLLREYDHQWHVAINAHATLESAGTDKWPKFMYEAKSASQEIDRIAYVLNRSAKES